MTPPTSARTRIMAWLKTYLDTCENPKDVLPASFVGATLNLSDIQSLVDAFDKPCGSCHPCTNYADETWRAAGRKPPHVYQWDAAQERHAAMLLLLSYCEDEARRPNPDCALAYKDIANKLAEVLKDAQ